MTLKMFIAKLLLFVPDRIFNKFLFRYKIGFWPNFTQPEYYSEKINYVKLYSNNKLRKMVADRIKVREYVKKKAPECELINILWTGEELDKDTFYKLPQKFVVKANHGSGMVLIVDKSKITYEKVYNITKKWKKIDYGKITRQFVYNGLPKILIVEEFINIDSNVLPDFKFLCINGEIEFIQVDLDRFTSHKRNLYDKDFNLLNVTLEYDQEYSIKKPLMFDKAKEIAKKLSEDFDFIRVDLYITDEKVYFGELTNTPGNGFEKFTPLEFDLQLGKKIKFEKEFNE
jgi:hypothetical protein